MWRSLWVLWELIEMSLMRKDNWKTFFLLSHQTLVFIVKGEEVVEVQEEGKEDKSGSTYPLLPFQLKHRILRYFLLI